MTWRDFLGLSSKEEITDGSKRFSTPTRASVMQWSFSNKVSAPPQFLSFEATQDDGTRKTGFDSLTSTRFMTISSAEAFDSKPKPYSSIIMQKHLIPDKQTGTPHYKVTTYPPQQYDIAHSIPRPHQVRIMPIANQTNQMISVTMAAPAHLSFHASTGQNVIGSATNPQPDLGVPVISPVSIAPTSTSIVGTTELRNVSKPSGGCPAQLTIFYAGSVCVYDDVSPEKAQAIMLLAGSGHSATPNKIVSTAQVEMEATVPRPSSGVDGFVGNQSLNTLPFSGLPSPISVTSHPAHVSAGVSISTTNITAMRSIGFLTPETSQAVSLRGPVSATVIPSAVPQARKASLARFLEKRKERATSASPYLSKQSHGCSTPGHSMNFAGSSPLPPINEKIKGDRG